MLPTPNFTNLASNATLNNTFSNLNSNWQQHQQTRSDIWHLWSEGDGWEKKYSSPKLNQWCHLHSQKQRSCSLTFVTSVPRLNVQLKVAGICCWPLREGGRFRVWPEGSAPSMLPAASILLVIQNLSLSLCICLSYLFENVLFNF